MIISKRSFYFIIAISIALSACNIFDNPGDRVVITVGSREITEDELKKEIRQITFEMGITDQEAKLGIRSLIKKIIDNYRIMEYGKEKGITVSDDELESAIKEIKRDYPPGVFREILLQRYIDPNDWKEGLRQELIIKKIITKATEDVSPATFQETKQYYESHRDEFKRPQTVRLRQIVTRTRDEAENILKQLAKGEDMGELAAKYSITPEANDGGALGWFAKGDMEESMEKVAFSLPIGKISEVLETPYGFHIFEVLSKRAEGHNTLPESLAGIESKLFLDKKDEFYRRWLKELRDDSPVKIDKKIYSDWSLEG
ncbi:MAG: peptidylprolyl isomerase [Deltaproteobacteria bacterium]|nr:peptidylprolyl isomerase [Deltaproteobacteria bacterium]